MCVLVVDIHFLKTDGFRLSRRRSFVEVMAPLVHLMLADLQMFPGEPWTASTSQLLFQDIGQLDRSSLGSKGLRENRLSFELICCKFTFVYVATYVSSFCAAYRDDGGQCCGNCHSLTFIAASKYLPRPQFSTPPWAELTSSPREFCVLYLDALKSSVSLSLSQSK